MVGDCHARNDPQSSGDQPRGDVSGIAGARAETYASLALGTDGMGRSDTREALRHFFEVDAGHVVVAVLSALVAQGQAEPAEVKAAMERHGIDADANDPAVTV